MLRKKINLKNIIFLVVIALLLIPQTRRPITIFMHKGLAYLNSPSVINDEQVTLSSYAWKLKNEHGELFNFNQTKGKVVFINFWATWCPPCVAEMPEIQSLYKDYKDQIEFVFVSNEDHQVINAFLDKHGYTFKVHSPITMYPKEFDVSSIPRTFLIDKDGRIVLDKTGAVNWNSDKVRDIINGLL